MTPSTQFDPRQRCPGDGSCGCSHPAPSAVCGSYTTGGNGRCVYCDHPRSCHDPNYQGPSSFNRQERRAMRAGQKPPRKARPARRHR